MLRSTGVVAAVLATLACATGADARAPAARTGAPVARRAAHATLDVIPPAPRAGEPVRLRFVVRDTAGRAIRFLQFVHERPMHVLVVPRDLATLAHVHPELAFDDAYEVVHTFPHGGRFRVFADYTPPGSGTLVDHFDVTVAGEAPRPAPLVTDHARTGTSDGVRATLAFEREPVANEDLGFAVTLADSATGAPVTDLQLFLGALAHFIVVSEDLGEFIHAHPLETGEVIDPSQGPATVHVHEPALLAKLLAGPSPPVIHAVTSFPRAGRYRLWAQFQRAGRVVTIPFAFAVRAPVARAAAPAPARAAAAPPKARTIRITVDGSGYTPARVEVPRGAATTLEFSRPRGGNCGGTVVIPSLHIRRQLPIGATVLVPLPPLEPSDVPFHCGMGMYEGTIVVR